MNHFTSSLVSNKEWMTFLYTRCLLRILHPIHNFTRVRFHSQFVMVRHLEAKKILKTSFTTTNSTSIRSTSSIWLEKDTSIFPSASQRMHPIPPGPRQWFTALSMLNLTKPQGGGSHFTCKKDLDFIGGQNLLGALKKSATFPSLILITSISFIQSRTFLLKIISFLVSHMTRQQRRSTFSRTTDKFLESMHSSVNEKEAIGLTIWIPLKALEYCQIFHEISQEKNMCSTITGLL
ncbi:hypothetical protein V6Z11_A07G130000 [Gossypium hirsutum]